VKKLLPLFLTTVLVSHTGAAFSQSGDRENNNNISRSETLTLVKQRTLYAQFAPSKTSPVLVPAGVKFTTDLEQNISSGKSKNGDRFTLKIKNSSIGKNKILKDSKINGHLENVVKAARGKKAKLNLVFDEIVLKDGSIYPIDATLVNTRVETKTKGKFLQNTGLILGGAIAGRFLGNRAKIKHGGLAGAGAAAAYVLSSPGGEVVLKRGTNVELKLKTPLQ
jgi:hypothetical protein